MSGLNPITDVILEIATIVTDSELNIVASAEPIVLQQPAKLFETMDDWNQKHHMESGLWQKTQESRISLYQAEQNTLDFLKNYTEHNTSPLCGNSIYQDKRFIAQYMPLLNQHLNYRLIDVSSIKELVKRWDLGGQITKRIEKKNNHRALDDIIESIEELRIYKEHIFLKNLAT